MAYHYVYRIVDILKQKFYYGTRTSKITPQKDIGIKYFSSSSDKEFIEDQKENPQNYKYKVVRVYNTREEAILLEIKLHSKFNVGINEKFYNKVRQTSKGFDTTETIRTQTKETIEKIKRARKYQVYSNKSKVKSRLFKDENDIKRILNG